MPNHTPATYADELAGGLAGTTDGDALRAAFFDGNGKTQNCLLRRLAPDQLLALRDRLMRDDNAPLSGSPFGVFDVNRELRRRNA